LNVGFPFEPVKSIAIFNLNFNPLINNLLIGIIFFVSDLIFKSNDFIHGKFILIGYPIFKSASLIFIFFLHNFDYKKIFQILVLIN